MNKYKYIISGYFTHEQRTAETIEQAKQIFDKWMQEGHNANHYYIMKQDKNGYYVKDRLIESYR